MFFKKKENINYSIIEPGDLYINKYIHGSTIMIAERKYEKFTPALELIAKIGTELYDYLINKMNFDLKGIADDTIRKTFRSYELYKDLKDIFKEENIEKQDEIIKLLKQISDDIKEGNMKKKGI